MVLLLREVLFSLLMTIMENILSNLLLEEGRERVVDNDLSMNGSGNQQQNEQFLLLAGQMSGQVNNCKDKWVI